MLNKKFRNFYIFRRTWNIVLCIDEMLQINKRFRSTKKGKTKANCSEKNLHSDLWKRGRKKALLDNLKSRSELTSLNMYKTKTIQNW